MTMALKSKEWFYKKCLAEVKDYDRFSHLAWGILQKGIGQSDGTRGHVTQASGVSQEFLAACPAHSPTIQGAETSEMSFPTTRDGTPASVCPVCRQADRPTAR